MPSEQDSILPIVEVLEAFGKEPVLSDPDIGGDSADLPEDGQGTQPLGKGHPPLLANPCLCSAAGNSCGPEWQDPWIMLPMD